jgi:hypothetical protein
MGELKPRVFVVDDDQSVRTGLANLLETEHYAVEMFASGLKAQRFFSRTSAAMRCDWLCSILDAGGRRPASPGTAPRGVARHESDRSDWQGNARDSHRYAGRRRVCLSRKAV